MRNAVRGIGGGAGRLFRCADAPQKRPAFRPFVPGRIAVHCLPHSAQRRRPAAPALVCRGDLRGLCHGGAGGNAAKPALSDPTPSCPDGGNRGLAVLPDSPLLRTAVSIPDDPGDESILPADFLLQDWFRGLSVGSGPPGGPAAGPPGCAAVFRRRLLCNASSLGQTAAGL